MKRGIEVPNYVANRLEANGTKEEIDRFLNVCCSSAKNGARQLHLERLVPVPSVLEGTEKSGDVDIGIELLTRVPRQTPFGMQSALDLPWVQKLGIKTYHDLEKWARSNRPGAIEKGRKSLKAFEDTGYWWWTDWAEANWGTSYILDSKIVERAETRVVATFDTPSTPAESLYRVMASRFPHLKIEIIAVDESTEQAYRFVASGGQLVEKIPAFTAAFVAKVYGG